ncbi:hypothetical protein [Dactylosporangium sp. NPDC048998]|uniref:hypothetical protein n=1 Tax=Dactylosporangium sp. NPDC048998 TaxID=3363976 RepID=UPI00371EA235
MPEDPMHVGPFHVSADRCRTARDQTNPRSAILVHASAADRALAVLRTVKRCLSKSSATVPEPITVAAALDAASVTLAELLGIQTVPELYLIADRRYVQGRPVNDGRRVERAELRRITFGGLGPRDDQGLFEVGMVGHDDRSWLTLYRSPASSRHQMTEQEWRHDAEFVCAPWRTRPAMVLAVGLALAAARISGGAFASQLRLLDPPQSDPDRMLGATRLPPSRLAFDVACQQYLDQFAADPG